MDKKVVILGLLLLAAAILAGGVFWFGKNKPQPVNQTNGQAGINEPLALNTIEATSSKNNVTDKINANQKCIKLDIGYKGTSEIKQINPNNTYSPDKYQLFKNNKYKFYYPKNWTISKDNETIIFHLPETARVYLDVNHPKARADFIRDYNSCIDKCFFNIYQIDDVEFSNDTAFCSENNTKDNLERILSGNYMEYLHSGMLPPGGTSNYIITKFIDDSLIGILIGSDDLDFLPVHQNLYKEKGYSSFTENDKQKLEEELDNLINDSLVIIESFTLVK